MLVDLRGHPEAEAVVDGVRLRDGVHQLVHEVQAQVTVLEQSPAALQTHSSTDISQGQGPMCPSSPKPDNIMLQVYFQSLLYVQMHLHVLKLSRMSY